MFWGHQSINWKLPASFFMFSLQTHIWVLWACDSWRLISRAASSCSNLGLDVSLPSTSSSTIPTSQQLSLRPAHSEDAVSTSSPIKPRRELRVTSQIRSHRTRHKPFHPVPHPSCSVSTPKSQHKDLLLASWEVMLFITFPSAVSVSHPEN